MKTLHLEEIHFKKTRKSKGVFAYVSL